jgi:hypothetical protein
MVYSTSLEATATGGVLLITIQAPPGTGTYATVTATSLATPAPRTSGFLSVVSGIKPYTGGTFLSQIREQNYKVLLMSVL